MEVICIESKAYQELINKIDSLSNSLLALSSKGTEKIIDNEEFVKLLKISKRTAQTYRDNGLITFSQIGHKIYYNMKDIETLLNKHSVKSI